MPVRNNGAAPGTVIFVAGAGRSGSTLLNGLLGQSPDVVALGELRYLWERAILGGRHCSCGRQVTSCERWGPVVARSGAECHARSMAADLDVVMRARNLFSPPTPMLANARRRALAGLGDVYEALVATTGRRVFVDSSKRPAWGALLARLPGIELRVVHLVRDPRATAWSWQRLKPLDDGGPSSMQRMAPARAAALWVLWNAATEMVLGRRAPYRMVSYDRLVREPSVVVDDLLAWAGASPSGCFDGLGKASLAVGHAIAGNADRFRSGPVEILSDDEWRRAMPRTQRALVGAATWPWRRRYLPSER